MHVLRSHSLVAQSRLTRQHSLTVRVYNALERQERADKGSLELAVLGHVPSGEVTAGRHSVQAVHRREAGVATHHQGTLVREVRESRERVQEAGDEEQSSEGIVVDELRWVRHVIQEGARAREPSG